MVYSSYAALWEEEIAHELATLLGLEQAVLEADATDAVYAIHFRFHSRLWHFSKLGYPDENNQHRIVECVKAEFTITGGNNNAAIRVYGLSDYAKPTIEEYVNGEWVVYDTTYHAYDGYMVYNDGDGTYSVAFCVDMTDAGEAGRTFRVMD